MKTALLFPGQGAQFVGMGKQLYEQHPRVKELYQQANQILGFDLSQLCFEGPIEELNKTNICQPALLVTSLAALEVFKEQEGKEIMPSFSASAGLSLGEYTALVSAGALSFEDAVKIVERRGTFMQEACDQNPSGMISIIGLKREQVREICDSIDGVIGIANINSPGQIVVSGENRVLDEVVAKAKEKGAKRAIPLKVAGAFHSPLMQSAEEKIKLELDKITIKPPAPPVVSNVTAQYVKESSDIKDCLSKQIVSSVLWEDSIKLLIQDGIKRFYEIGPGKVLTGLLQRIDRSVEGHNYGA